MDNRLGEAAYTAISLSPDTPAPSERRDGKRHLTVLQTGKLVVGDREELCLIRNISSGGMMAAIYGPLGEGDRVTIEFKLASRIEGSVIWVRSGHAGIQFDDRIDVYEVLTPRGRDGASRVPRSPRLNVSGLAIVTIGGTEHSVQIHDISPGGVKIDRCDGGEVDDDAVVNMPGLAIAAGVIRWIDGELTGVSFNRTLSLEQIAAWASAQTLAEQKAA